MNFKVELLHESVMTMCGKNLFHCLDTNTLYYTDVLGGTIMKMDLNNNNKMHMCKILGEKVLVFCIPIQGKKDQFIVGAGKRLLLVNWDGIHTNGTIVRVLADIPVNGVRLNECNIDSKGRLYFGTMICEEQGDILDMHKRIGCLYRFSMTEGLVQLKDNIGLSNGLVWNNNNTKMYFVDSYDLNVKEFDYDMKTGNINNEKIVVDLTNYGQMKKIFPDGMTIDNQDFLYVCMFGGGKILKINTKTHKMEHEIKVTVNNTTIQQLTGCVFGGKNMDHLYVTSCGLDVVGHQTYPSGFLFKINNLGCKGMEMHKFLMN